ncbi:MAG: hypothetical protein LC104_01275, partial [Bacteroidales bacterium]|nr:hypothetical protein [Bacteroidales bacterium]
MIPPSVFGKAKNRKLWIDDQGNIYVSYNPDVPITQYTNVQSPPVKSEYEKLDKSAKDLAAKTRKATKKNPSQPAAIKVVATDATTTKKVQDRLAAVLPDQTPCTTSSTGAAGKCWCAKIRSDWFDGEERRKGVIEERRLGDNVPTLREGEPGYEESLVQADRRFNPATDRAVWLMQERADGNWTKVGLIRSLDWLSTQGVATIGDRTVLNLVEMGVSGEFAVLAIDPCPEIPAGPGRTVTGVFRHGWGVVYDLWVVGESEPLGGTASHPVWSVDRNTWVPLGELRPGERVSTSNGTASVERVEYLSLPKTPSWQLDTAGDVNT